MIRKVWCSVNDHKLPGLILTESGSLYRCYVYIKGLWHELYLPKVDVTTRDINISNIIYEDRTKLTNFDRIE